MPEALPDYYGILGVAHDASPQQIHEAFRHRAHECHPDLHPDDPDAVERFKSVNEAYHLLSNEEERRAYDAALTTREAGHADLETRITLGLRELYLGCQLRLTVPRACPCPSCEGSGWSEPPGVSSCPSCRGSGWGPEEIFLGVRTREPCAKCHGRGLGPRGRGRSPCLPCRGLGWYLVPTPTYVRLPPGLEDGQRLRVAGQGQPLLAGGQGDLFVRIEVRPGPWRRNGEDLFFDVPVSASLLRRGGRVPLRTPLDHLEVAIPRGSRFGELVPVPRRGLPFPEGEGRGNLWIRLVPPAASV